MTKPTDKRPGAIAREIVEAFMRRVMLSVTTKRPEAWLARRIAAEIRKARRGGQ